MAIQLSLSFICLLIGFVVKRVVFSLIYFVSGSKSLCKQMEEAGDKYLKKERNAS